ncbi:EamA family transporter RarD [Streptococcus dentapri]|uniref:EamA family transporter RarD n=1 Tax=Streptococcus dentapri TaxID=573564 RepID=A0ABV8D0K2_9STRE
MTKKQKGLLLGLATYLFWAFLSLYWKLLSGVDAYSTFSYRIIWTVITMLIYMMVTRSGGRFSKELKNLAMDKLGFARALLASLLIALNWLTYIYAITNGYATQSSLGYYMMPLVSVLLALVFLKESLTPATSLAVIIASLGVVLLLIQTGQLPVIALVLAFSFGFYSLIKKGTKLSSDVALFFKAGVILTFVLIYLLFFNQESPLDYSLSENILLAMSGIVTAIPLLLYAEALKRAPLNLIGFIQYLNPTIQLLIALFVFKEDLSKEQLTGLIFIWIAIIVFVLRQVLLYNKQRKVGKDS